MPELYTHFKNLYSSEAGAENLNLDQNFVIDDDLDGVLTISEIKTAVFSQYNNKGAGENNLFAEIFKHSFDSISVFLLETFNRIFDSGEYPKIGDQVSLSQSCIVISITQVHYRRIVFTNTTSN